jgi:hypothetical protein
MGYTSRSLAGRGTPDPSIPGGLAVDTNLGWKGAEKYVATVPQTFDLWQNPQERYDFFMNNFKARSTAPVMVEEPMFGILRVNYRAWVTRVLSR